jgi:hypothetical protein
LVLVDAPSDIMQTCFNSCVGPRVSLWLLACLTTFAFRLSLTHFLATFRAFFGLPHPTVAHLSQCQCDHTIDNLDTHLLRCPYKNECITTHDTFQDIIITIILESETHV